MTREEVINVLKKYDVYGCGVCLQDDLQNNLDAKEALDMAIELLSNDTTEKPNDAVEQKNDVVAEPTDLIRRADAIEAIVMELDAIDHVPKWVFDRLTDKLNRVLSADRPSGEWVIRENGNKECSLCGHERQDGWDYFCGYCGANMRSGGLYYADGRPTGEWIYKEADPNIKGDWYCDHCGVRAEVDLYGEWILSDYCPNCGVKMGSDTR